MSSFRSGFDSLELIHCRTVSGMCSAFVFESVGVGVVTGIEIERRECVSGFVS